MSAAVVEDTCAPGGVLDDAALSVLDRAIFTGHGRFVAIDADNRGVATVGNLEQARQLQYQRVGVVTLAGPLHPSVAAADIDPADTGAEPEAGEAAAEELLAWCETHGLPLMVRASGRPGGRHVLAVLPENLGDEWRVLCTQVARRHGVGVGPRRTLRLLSAPHRRGFPSPVLISTMTPDDVPSAGPQPMATAGAQQAEATRIRTVRRHPQARGDRSRREFGDACARVRAGWGSGRAWTTANVAGSKAAEQGELNWRRWVWAPAVTRVAAEQQLSEPQAWQWFRRASPARARQLGLEGWQETYWGPALEEAGRGRPRRVHTDRAAAPVRPEAEVEAERREIDRIRTGLRSTADQAISQAGRRPQFARSVAAALDALAEYIVRREGSISLRSWAEAARLDRKTLTRVCEFAAEHGILYRARTYTGGSTDSAAWRPGLATEHELATVDETSPTRWYTPPEQTWGHAHSLTQVRRHRREQHQWRLRTELSAHTEKTGESYAVSQHPAAKALRSLHHQRQWWASLTTDQQAARRRHRRDMLGRMHRSERHAWLDWLARRATLSLAADMIAQGRGCPTDHDALATAPLTLHLGLRDPHWRARGTIPPLRTTDESVTTQLALAA